MTPAITILIVDDEVDMRLLVRTVLDLSTETFSVVGEAADGLQALQEWERLDPPPVPQVVILDNRMPGLTGLEVAERIRAALPDQAIVLFSAYLDDNVRRQAALLGIDACVPKSDVSRLPQVIKDVLQAA